jgi:hypothetical protein
MYGVFQTLMGRGVVEDAWSALKRRARRCKRGLRILAAESPQNIPVQIMANVTMIDWRNCVALA